jgi:hypothetical protein
MKRKSRTVLGTFLLLLTMMHCKAQEVKCDYSFPPMVCGSSWGLIFQRLYKNGDFESMLNLTSSESIKKYGKEKIRTFYQVMSFGYEMKLKSWTWNDAYYILNYAARVNATEIIVRMQLCKGDTAKIVLTEDVIDKHYFLYK